MERVNSKQDQQPSVLEILYYRATTSFPNSAPHTLRHTSTGTQAHTPTVKGCVYRTGTGTENLALRVPAN